MEREKSLDSAPMKKVKPVQVVTIATTVSSGANTSGNSSAVTSLAVHTPSTPRIDISRASSSSHHEDSRDSSPENVFDQVSKIYSSLSYSLISLNSI